jgi:spore germination cell wall hydrolase CwlJ-like protein
MKKFILALVMLMSASVAHAERKNMEVLFSESDEQAWCLAQNIYYEARGSNLADQAAVADVVLNRVKDTRYPDTVCEVVRQGEKHANGQMKRNRCQFSWYCDGKSDYPTNKDSWAMAQQTAYMMLYLDEFRGITEGATHYHANYVTPRWAKELHLVGRIGDHVFYRWK